MSGAVDRTARRLFRLRVVSVILLCALTYWFAAMSGTYRLPHRLLAFTTLVGAVLVVLNALVLARRIASATPSEVSGHLIEITARYAPLVVINLMLLNVVAPVLGLIAGLMTGVSWVKTWLTLFGSLSGHVVSWLFALSVGGLAAVLLMRVLDRAMVRWRPVEIAVSNTDRAIVLVAALYCVWGLLLTFNGTFDTSSSTERRREIASVWGVPGTTLWWADLTAGDGHGTIERVLIYPARDQLVPTLLGEGQHVRVQLRAGLFRLPWVERMRLDFEHELEPLVAAAPSAATPRKQLIEVLLRDGRWADAARHAAAYARYHPGDRDLVKRVVAVLREARQGGPAGDLDRIAGLPVAQARGAP